MDYGSLIRDAWSMTWRYRFLWILGLFAPGTVGGCSPGGSGFQYRFDESDLVQMPRGFTNAIAEMTDWLAANIGLVVVVLAFLALLALALFIVSFIAQGGLSKATADLAEGRPSSSGLAWRAGLRLFWRYLLMWLLLAAAAMAVILVVSIVVAVFVGIIIALGDAIAPRIAVGVILGLFGLVGILTALLLAVAVSIVVAYAQRAIAVEDIGPIAALQTGYAVLRSNLGASLLVWLINLALGIVAGIGIVLVLVVVAAVLGAVAAALVLAFGLTGPTIVYLALVALLAVALAWGIGAIVNTFFWTYWTLAYLRLTRPSEPIVTVEPTVG